MGLDMYLYATKHAGNWDHFPQTEKDQYNRVIATVGITNEDFRHLDTGKSVDVSMKIAYWRKANAIHKWFVDTCQNGNDDCRLAEVEREQLEQLVCLCKQALTTLETVEGDVRTGTSYHPDGRVVEHRRPGRVVAQPDLAHNMLPTQSGFFFGSTDYDEGYLDDLQNTVKQLEAVLNNPKFNDWSFEYHSSW